MFAFPSWDYITKSFTQYPPPDPTSALEVAIGVIEICSVPLIGVARVALVFGCTFWLIWHVYCKASDWLVEVQQKQNAAKSHTSE